MLIPDAPAASSTSVRKATTEEYGAITPHGGKGWRHKWKSLTSRVRAPKSRFCPAHVMTLNLSRLMTPPSKGAKQI